MLCAHCSTPIPDDSRFCLNCGSLVSDAEGQSRATATMDASSTARMERVLREDTKGEFQIERQLGKGGMAAVYLATEVRLGRKVAIKVLPPELTFGHGVERFMREAKTAAALDHPHIIPIYRISSGDTIFWYAMKYVEGRSLDEVVKEKGMFSVEETVNILGPVADALEYAHRKRVIHRDVKPANVMLDAQDRVIVTDFGIAKALTEGTLTASGAAVGTPYFMSPEQGKGGTVSGAADQYSLAVVAYRMLSGQLPFQGESAVEIVHKHCVDPPPPLDILRPGLPACVYAAISCALSKDPADRFPTITGFIQALRGEKGIPASPAVHRVSATTVVRAERSGVPRKVIVAGAVVVVVAAAAGGFLLLRGGAPSGRDMAGAGSTSVPTGVASRPTGDSAGKAAADMTATAAARLAAPSPGAPPTAAATGRITISGLPSGGTVTIDAQRRSGVRFTFREGQHIVRLEATGFVPVVDTVRLRAGQTARVAWTGTPVPAPPVATKPPVAAPTEAKGAPAQSQSGAAPPSPAAVAPAPNPLGDRGLLLLNVEPWAAIAVDGVARGQSRTLADTLRPGPHLITLTRPGYARVDTTVTIRAGESHRVAVRMRTSP